MKLRTMFVSNSSSSSFVCDICNETFNGYDGDYGDIKEVTCEGGHSFCDEHISEKDIERYIKNRLEASDIGKDEKEMLEEAKEENSLETMMDYYSYELPFELCPICNFKIISDLDLVDYLIKTTGISKIEVFDEIKKENKRRKKIHLFEYIEYTCKKLSTTKTLISKGILEKFKDYEDFYKYLGDK